MNYQVQMYEEEWEKEDEEEEEKYCRFSSWPHHSFTCSTNVSIRRFMCPKKCHIIFFVKLMTFLMSKTEVTIGL
jgi:hypothetical protein